MNTNKGRTALDAANDIEQRLAAIEANTKEAAMAGRNTFMATLIVAVILAGIAALLWRTPLIGGM